MEEEEDRAGALGLERLQGLAVRRATICVRLAGLMLPGQASQEVEERAYSLMGASNRELEELAARFGVQVEVPPDPASERLVGQWLDGPLQSPDKLAQMVIKALRETLQKELYVSLEVVQPGRRLRELLR